MQDPVAPLDPRHGAAERGAERTDGGNMPIEAPAQGRREVIAAAALAAAGLCSPGARNAAAQAPPSPPAPRMARPAAGDTFVFAAGERSGKPVELDDLAPGGPHVLAWAVEPNSGVVRNGSRLNQVLLVRVDPASLDEATANRSVDGVVAYSAVCTHAQCPVSEWRHEKGVLHCPCHGSEFDPKQGGKVVGGPAPRPLAALPLRVAEGVRPAEGAQTAGAGGAAEGAGPDPAANAAGGGGVLVVARPFVGKVGTAS